MPQNTVLPQYKADYPILAPAQKPGGVTVSTVLISTAVPNKPTYAAGTIQMVSAEMSTEEAVTEEAVQEESVEEEPVEEAEDAPPTRGKPRRR